MKIQYPAFLITVPLGNLHFFCTPISQYYIITFKTGYPDTDEPYSNALKLCSFGIGAGKGSVLVPSSALIVLLTWKEKLEEEYFLYL